MRLSVFVLAIATIAACGPKGQETGQGADDSTAVESAFTDSAKVQDSIGPAPSADSAPLLQDSTAVNSATTAPRADAYIGRDSAFGPTFTVDPSGKVAPIVPAKKKP